MKPTIQLITIDGDLYYPPNSNREWMPDENLILICVYDAGDCDTISWPNPNRKNLGQCLFDDRECGVIDDQEVLLPDGTSAWPRKTAKTRSPS